MPSATALSESQPHTCTVAAPRQNYYQGVERRIRHDIDFRYDVGGPATHRFGEIMPPTFSGAAPHRIRLLRVKQQITIKTVKALK